MDVFSSNPGGLKLYSLREKKVVVVTTVFEYSRLYTEIAKRCIYNPKASFKEAR
jgi:hypothetical protein